MPMSDALELGCLVSVGREREEAEVDDPLERSRTSSSALTLITCCFCFGCVGACTVGLTLKSNGWSSVANVLPVNDERNMLR